MMVEIEQITEVNQYIAGLKAIIFDLDDTLYGEKEYIRSGFHTVAGILPQIEDCEEKLWKAFEEGKAALDEVLLDEGIFTEELKQKCLYVYRSHRPVIHLYKDVIKIFTQMKAQGCKLGIITDGRPESQRVKIKALGLEKYVDYIIITDELGGVQYRKPCERAFQMMKEYMNLSFSEMCYVGDNVKKDFIAPEKLGMKYIWFHNKEGLYY